MADTIKHRHQVALPDTGSDVSTNEWNDSLVVAGGVNDQVMTRDSTQADGWKWATPAAGGTVVIVKLADQTITASTVLTNDSELLTAVLANSIYVGRLMLWASSGATSTPDIKISWTMPALATISTMLNGLSTAAAAATDDN